MNIKTTIDHETHFKFDFDDDSVTDFKTALMGIVNHERHMVVSFNADLNWEQMGATMGVRFATKRESILSLINDFVKSCIRFTEDVLSRENVKNPRINGTICWNEKEEIEN